MNSLEEIYESILYEEAKTIVGNIGLSNYYLDELPEFLNGITVYGHVNVSGNALTSLKNCPAYVHGNFNCSYNKINDLTFLPKMIDDEFFLEMNELVDNNRSPWPAMGIDVPKYVIRMIDDIVDRCSVKRNAIILWN